MPRTPLAKMLEERVEEDGKRREIKAKQEDLNEIGDHIELEALVDQFDKDLNEDNEEVNKVDDSDDSDESSYNNDNIDEDFIDEHRKEVDIEVHIDKHDDDNEETDEIAN